MNSFMKRTFFVGSFLYCLGFGYSTGLADTPSAPTQTRVIDSFSQMGIDSTIPRFGWVVNDTDRGESQSAYEIIVATNEMDISNNLGDAWDSGKVLSDQQYGVTYAGTPLAKTSQYWWKVRTWNMNRNVSPWSMETNFVTAFFQPGDWDAGVQWIKYPLATTGGTNANPPAIFRKEFLVAKPVIQAYLFITGLGQFVASLNGTNIGNNVMDPAWSDYTRSIYYVTFDVTSQLQQGTNALGVMLGNGWYAYPGIRDFGPMRLWGQLHIVYTDGTTTNIDTDPTWKSTTSPFTRTEVHGSENYDARLAQVGWNVAGFNDGGWSNAVATSTPGGVLVSQNAPPIIVQQTLEPIQIFSPSANVYVYDFGQNMNGQYGITVSGTAGMTVNILPGEALNSSDGPVAPSNTTGSIYTLKGGGPETWQLTFSSTGFRYIQLSNVTTNSQNASLPLVQNVTACRLSSAATSVGSFSASDTRYDQIYDLALRTLENELCSIHMDGPNYERLGWQEVVWISPSSSMYQHDLFTFLAKVMRDVRDAQRTFGLCPDIVPNWFYTTNTPSQGPYDDAPAWGASIFNAPWLVYSTYGDTKILQDNYDTMTNYLAYLKSREVNGLITYGLGDWMAPAGSPIPNVEGAVYVHDTDIMRDIANVLGNVDDATFYSNEFVRVQTAYNNAYFNTNFQCYQPMNQANQAIPLEFGIVPTGSVAAVQQALVNDIAVPRETGSPPSGGASVGSFGPVLPYHVTTGDIGTTFLWRALGDAGQNDLVQTMIMQPALPSYLSMINGGETTITENWDYPVTRSHDHDMYAGIFEWLFRTLGGISLLQPGYSQIQFKPGMPDGLTNVTVSYNSVRGVIASSWTRSATNTILWNVGIPVNATAKVYLPTFGTPLTNVSIAESGTTIFQNGTVGDSVLGVGFDAIEGTNTQTFIVFNVGSGNYQFAWNVQYVQPVPMGLVASAALGQVDLSWSASAGASSYNVKRATASGGPYTTITNVTATSYDDTAVISGATYFYVVSAVNGSDESADSVQASATPFIGPTILFYDDSFSRGSTSSPSNLNGSLPDVVDMNDMRWNAPGGVTTDGSKGNIIISSGNNSIVSSLPLSGLVPGLTYEVSADLIPTPVSDSANWIGIAFVCANNTSSIYTNAVAFLLARGNGSGQTFYGSPGLNNGLEIAGTGGANTFQITLTLDATGAAMVFFSTNGVIFQTGSLASNIVALIQGVGVVANDDGSFDNFKLLISPPAAPASLTAVAGNRQAILNWTPSLGATAYNLKRANISGGSYTLVVTDPGLTFTNTGLSNGVMYYFVVSATNSFGESANSMEAGVRPSSPVPPQFAFSLNGEQLQLAWPADHTGWSLEIQTNTMGVGLSTNWFMIPGSNSTNQMLIPIGITNGSVFFRLVYP